MIDCGDCCGSERPPNRGRDQASAERPARSEEGNLIAEACVIMSTTDSEEEGRRLSQLVVESGLAACVQRLPIGSIYECGGNVEDTGEVLLLIKTSVDRYAHGEPRSGRITPARCRRS